MPMRRPGAVAGAVVLLVVAAGAAAQPVATPAGCCRLAVSWHPYARAHFAAGERGAAARRTRLRLERAQAAVADAWRPHGICLAWAEGEVLAVPARLRLLGPGDPAAADLEALVPASSAAAVLFVERLEAFDPRTQGYRGRRGATLRPGSPLALVALDERQALGTIVGNELLHVLGLRDAELGAGEHDARHTVQPEMWTFLRRSCAAAADRAARLRLVAEKDRCLAAAGGAAAACYGDD